MADNVTLPGTGVVVGADEVTIGGVAQQVQRVKLVDGTDGGTDLLPGTTARGLSVDPRPNVARIQVASAGLTTASTAYVSGDQVGTLLEFAGAARGSGGGGTVLSATLVDKAKVTGAVDLFLFDRSVTPAADNAANDFSDADMLFCLGVVRFPAPLVTASNSIATIEVSGLAIKANATSVFGALVTRSGHAFFGAAGDLVATLAVALD